MFLIFLEGVKITSIGLKLNRPQLQHWLLFLEYNRLSSKDLNVVAGLPVPIDYDCVDDSSSTCNVLLSSFLVRSNQTTLQT